jgi:hypothetical protein
MPAARIFLQLIADFVVYLGLLIRPRKAIATENLILRRQLALYQERKVDLRRIDPATRITLALLSRLFDCTQAIQGVFESFTGQGWKRWQYRRWVEEALVGEIENPFEAVKWEQVLGEEGFLRQLKDNWNQREGWPENYAQKRKWSASVGAQ